MEFLKQPSPYYYMYPGTVKIIPCLAVQQEVGSSLQHTLNATFFRNGTPVSIFNPPPYHYLIVDDLQNMIQLAIGAAGQDSHTTYHCTAQGHSSATTAVYVGGE